MSSPIPQSQPLNKDVIQEHTDGQSYYSVNEYKNFAKIYDTFGSEEFCLSLVGHIREALDELGLPPGTDILDVACGTGVITTELAKAGYRMQGVDLSENMLEQARKRALDNLVDISFKRVDMRDFTIDMPVPIIISTHDSLDHLFDEQDLNAAFASFAKNLLPGGLLIFDMNCWEGIRHLHGRTVFVETDDRSGAYYLTAEDHMLETNIVGFLKQDSGLYKRFDEQLFQRCYTDSELTNLLEKNGFQILQKNVIQQLQGEPFKQMWIAQSESIEVPGIY